MSNGSVALSVETLNTERQERMQKYVPVVGKTGKPLMPTTHQKANKLIAKGRAIRRFDRGIFYIQLTDREDGYTQPMAVGIDPGSKKEALTIKSAAHTYLNVQADAVTWVSEAEETSTTMRRSRRSRKTPYRAYRPLRHSAKIELPPSTRARWGWKLRLCTWLARYYPIDQFVVEDIAAGTKPLVPSKLASSGFTQNLARSRPSRCGRATKPKPCGTV